MSDLIDRQAAIDVCDYAIDLWHGQLGEGIVIAVKKKIEELPPAQPERKRGKWIPVTNGRGGHECNLCHTYAPSFQSGDEWITDYCPNCGAEMRAERRTDGN